MTKQKKKDESSSAPVCSVHGKEHLYDVQCKHDPVWTSIYIYRQACKCGDVLVDWHQ